MTVLTIAKFVFFAALSSFLSLLCVAEEVSSQDGLPGGRAIRSAAGPLDPVDCLLSAWSPWTRCDPCMKKRYRHATLKQPSQFAGEPCQEHGREEEPCTPPSRYSCQNLPSCQGFVCVTTGRCVPRRLRCNGDDDCGDGSDERGCSSVHRACSEKTEEYWGIENLAKGVNILNSDLEGVVLDNRYYAGSCLPYYIQNTRFRKPYNLQHYSVETKGDYDFKFDAHESYSSFESHRMESSMSKTSVSFGIKVPGVFELGFNYNDYKHKKSVQKMRRFSGTESSFIRAHSRLEVARYALKSSELMLHPEFLQRLRALPMEYSYGQYRQVFLDYGTHYITEATLGGDYEYTVVLNSKKLEDSGYSLNDAKECLQLGFNIGAKISEVYVSIAVEAGGCEGLLQEFGDSKKEKKFVEDFVAEVKGGDSESITRLVAKKLPTPQAMQEWGEAVYYNPAFVQTKMEPLFGLVTSKDFVNAGTLKKHLEKALTEYLSEASSCRCAACLNNGVAVLKGTRCDCVCPVGSSGRGCETSQRTGVAVDGGWSCWSSWSTCSNRKRQRNRHCTQPSPQNGGVACSGTGKELTDCF